MGRARTLYKLACRYASGNEISAYGLICENGKKIKVTRDQMAFLVGRDQVTNVKAQIYQEKLIFKGEGVDIRQLPVVREKVSKPETAPAPASKPAPVPKPTPEAKPAQETKPAPKKDEFQPLRRVIADVTCYRHFGYTLLPGAAEPDIRKMTESCFAITTVFTLGGKIRPRYYVLESVNGTIYLRQQKQTQTYVCKDDNKGIFMQVLFALLGYVKEDSLNNMKKASSLPDKLDRDTFGNYIYRGDLIGQVLDGEVSSNYGLGLEAMEAIVMLQAFKGVARTGANSILFSPRNIKNNDTLNTFSVQYFSHIAAFASVYRRDKSEALTMCVIDNAFAINTDVTADEICIPNAGEVIVKPSLKCTGSKLLGHIDGKEFRLAKFENVGEVEGDYERSVKRMINHVKSHAQQCMDLYLICSLIGHDTDIKFTDAEPDVDRSGKYLVSRGNRAIIIEHMGPRAKCFNATVNGEVIECDNKQACTKVVKYMLGA